MSISDLFGRLITDRIVERIASTARADDIADCCRDAYSFDAFGPVEWRKCARMMAARGFDETEIEAVLRSKWVRWSRDAEGTYCGTAKGLATFLDRQPPNELARLTRGSFQD